MASRSIVLVVLIGAMCPGLAAQAQFGTPIEFQNQTNDAKTQRTGTWKVGIQVDAATGPCTGIHGTFSLPVDWPEQDVKVVEENISDTVRRAEYRDLDEGVRLMEILAPRLDFGQRAEATVTLEITRRTQPPPADTSVYQIPRSMPRQVRAYLANSPGIDGRNTRIRSKAKEIFAEEESAWGKVESLHDWIKENVEHTNDPLHGAVETLQQKRGNHEDLAGLFVAFCRAGKIPARIVWVPNYCYAEFYLEGNDDAGEWFPCELKEKTTFGVVSQPYMILQKGENIQVPYSKERQRFVAEHLTVRTGHKPTVTFIRQNLGTQ